MDFGKGVARFRNKGEKNEKKEERKVIIPILDIG
jgi:hypothetical protein